MQGIIHTLALHLVYQKAHRTHHYHRVGSLNRDNHIIEIFAFTNTKKLHTALYNAFRCIAITTHDAVGQRPMINSDTHRRMVFFAYLQKRYEAVFYFFDFVGIRLIGIFQYFECASGVYIVTGIDANLLCITRCHIGNVGVKVHIGNQRRVVSLSAQSIMNRFEILGFTFSLCR